MSTEMHPEVVRLVATFVAQDTDLNDNEHCKDQTCFGLTCKQAYEPLKPELDWLVETEKQDNETWQMEKEDKDVQSLGLGREYTWEDQLALFNKGKGFALSFQGNSSSF
jgi:hypothetical protein